MNLKEVSKQEFWDYFKGKEYTTEQGVSVESVELSMKKCEDIGFINFSKLKDYCK